MKSLIIFIFAAQAQAMDYVADHSNPFYYCHSKHYEGQILSVGDIDRMIGLADGRSFSFEFVEGLRKRLAPMYCLTVDDYIDRLKEQ